jgi:(2Fe-2S) ferredoxin
MNPPDSDAPPTAPVRPRIGAHRRHLLVCTGPRCTRNGEGEALFEGLSDKLAAAGLTAGGNRVKRTRCSCFAACKGGPILAVWPDGIWYYGVTDPVMDRIVAEHLVGGVPVAEHVFHRAGEAGAEAGA